LGKVSRAVILSESRWARESRRLEQEWTDQRRRRPVSAPRLQLPLAKIGKSQSRIFSEPIQGPNSVQHMMTLQCSLPCIYARVISKITPYSRQRKPFQPFTHSQKLGSFLPTIPEFVIGSYLTY
jgi:hypothetical protein